MPEQLAITDPKLLAKLYRSSGMHREYPEDGPVRLIEHELDLDCDNYCGWCQQHALRVVLHAPEDATWHCWGCARIRTSLELVYERPHSTWEEIVGMFFACTERGRLIDPVEGWNSFLQRRLNDILSFGRFFIATMPSKVAIRQSTATGPGFALSPWSPSRGWAASAARACGAPTS